MTDSRPPADSAGCPTLAYEVTEVSGSVRIVIGTGENAVELWTSAEGAVRFGEDVAAVGRTAKEQG
jgi:hypothetical protein